MRNRYFAWMAALVMILLALAGTACAEEWTCPVCGQTGNTGNFCPSLRRESAGCRLVLPGMRAGEYRELLHQLRRAEARQ